VGDRAEPSNAERATNGTPRRSMISRSHRRLAILRLALFAFGHGLSHADGRRAT